MTPEQLQDTVERQQAVIRSLVGALRKIADGRTGESSAAEFASNTLLFHGILEPEPPAGCVRVLTEDGFKPIV